MKTNRLFILIFGTVLVIPLCFLIFGIREPVLEENRLLSPMPAVNFSKQFLVDFTKYFNDHFGLRTLAITADKLVRFKLFEVSSDKSVYIGKNNWLFYMPDIFYVDTVNGQPFSDDDLKKIENNLAEIQKRFEKEGIKFYFMVTPNKQTIYPEFLPDYVKKVNPKSKLEQVELLMEKNKEINFVDPKKELLEAKKKNQVYFKYDTHWNDFGAFVGYQKLMKKIGEDFKNVKSKKEEDFIFKIEKLKNKDLAIMMGLEKEFKESGLAVKNNNWKAKMVEEKCPKKFTQCPLVIKEVEDKSLPKLVMFRDSFGVGMIPFISEHFSRSYYYWGQAPFKLSVVKNEKPDIVVVELVERELWRLKDKMFED